MRLKAPFPYFGGKSRVASMVWERLGDVKHYIEPFCGSCAVLLARPDYDHSRHVETVNDADGHIANIWRSMKLSPEKTAEFADEPVNHIELSVRKAMLNRRYPELREKLLADENYHDPEMAGRYIWASCCWIGSGLTRIGQIPHLTGSGKGIHGQIPHLTGSGKGGRKESIYAWFN